MKIRSIILAFALLGTAATAHAQDRTLERVQNLIATGRLTEARNTLGEWEKENRDPASAATPDDRARALFLTGVLSGDAKAAEDAFIGVVLSHPFSPVAPEALLRLGQGLYTAGETDRAIEYLERLRSDYPSAPERETAMLWLTRAQLARGDAAAACGTARESLFSTSNANVRTLIELERDRACEQSGGVATTTGIRPSGRAPRSSAIIVLDDPEPADSTPVVPSAPVEAREQRRPDAQPAAQTPASRAPAAEPLVLPNLAVATDSIPWDSPVPPRRDERAARVAAPTTNAAQPDVASATVAAQPVAREADQPVDSGPEYAVQTAAFSERRAAETIAGELRGKGFDARIVTVPGSAYFRVRYGAFRTNREAAAAALHIRDAGFATLIVNDVRLERR